MTIDIITSTAADRMLRPARVSTAALQKGARGPPDITAEWLPMDTARRISFLTDSTRRAAGTQGGFLVPKRNSNSRLANRQRVLRAKIGDVVHDSGQRQFQGFKTRAVVKVSERTETRAAWFRAMLLNEAGEINTVEVNDD